MASEDVQTNLRLPADLKKALVMAADANNRSLSAEAASRLADSFMENDAVGLVLDQAKQIKELRAKVMESNFVIAQAFQVLTGADGDRDACIQALSEVMHKTADDATAHFKVLLNEHLEKTGQTPEDWIKTVKAELAASRSKSGKTNP